MNGSIVFFPDMLVSTEDCQLYEEINIVQILTFVWRVVQLSSWYRSR
jgi:hypothetical protein